MFEADFTEQPEGCLKCGVIGFLYRHGRKVITIRDSPMRGHPVRIKVPVQRYHCRDCGETFLQPLKCIAVDRRMTTRCVEYIQNQCLRDSFAHVAGHVGCDEKTVRNIASHHIEELNASYEPYLPEWLGIDETMIDGKMRCVLTDIEARRPIDMLSGRDKPLVARWIYNFQDRSPVRGIAIDMWRPYKELVSEALPGRPIIVDRFHVVRMANHGLDRIRIRLGKEQSTGRRRDWMRHKVLLRKRPRNLTTEQELNLDVWLRNEPDIALAYQIKESFFRIYSLQKKREAAQALEEWKASIPDYFRKDFKDLITAVTNWREEILAYFDHPIGNSYTEALNGMAKVINRVGRGYSFDVLRARVLFGAPRPRRQRFAGVLGDIPLERVMSELERMQAQLENTCGSCSGIFPTESLYVAQIRRGKIVLACEQCHHRFQRRPLVLRG